MKSAWPGCWRINRTATQVWHTPAATAEIALIAGSTNAGPPPEEKKWSSGSMPSSSPIDRALPPIVEMPVMSEGFMPASAMVAVTA